MHPDDVETKSTGDLFHQLKNARRLSQEYNELLDVLPDIIYKLDPDGHFVYLSKAVTILGYTRGELIGKHFSVIVHPDDLPNVSRVEVLPRYRGKVTGEADMPKLFDERRTGHRVTKNLVMRLMPKGAVADKEAAAHHAFQTEISATGTYRESGTPEGPQFEGSVGVIQPVMQLPENAAEFYGEIATFGKYNGDVTNPERKFEGTVGVIRDISGRMRLEQEKAKLEIQLLHSQKMEALGTIAGGVAHDLNNILGVLVGYSELMLEMIPEGNPLKSYASDILQASERGAVIIQDLLTLARRGVAVSKVINVNSVISDYFKTPEFEKIKTHHQNVTFRKDLEKGLLNIKGSDVHLGKAIMNLLLNAAEAITGQGEVVIRTENRYVEKPVRGNGEVREGDYVILTVTDNGGGIAPADLAKIFEPFYTKKVMGRSGTGLGLAVVWGTVRDHRGHLDVQSAVGKGSTFTIYLPVTREELSREQPKVSPEEYLGRGESILVVDDVEGQRQVATRMLTRLNYQVHAVCSGEEAVEYLKANSVDLLLLDMIMNPGIDGLETYRRVLAINPSQKAVIVSGFSETERVDKARELGAGAYVQKPYVIEKIGLAIRGELSRNATVNPSNRPCD
ncbi:MAG: hybrid sensor histidine kinase/response regulator [Syntrophales bacterium]